MEYSGVFHKYVAAWQRHPRYIDSEGGARSSKTISALQFLVMLASTDKEPTITSVVSETMPHLKRGAVRDFQSEAVMGDGWDVAAWNKTAMTYAFPNGSIIEFFSADSPSKVHGPQRHRLFLNEAQNIPWETARQLFVRTSEFILYDYNPTHPFWAHDRVQPRDNCIHIHSTYRDNPYLSPTQKAEIEANRGDANWWRVYGEGKVGVLEGLIFPDFDQVDALPDPDGLAECYGLDYGFTNDPTVLVHVLLDNDRREAWVDECFYERGLVNAPIPGSDKPSIVKRLTEAGVPKRGVPVFGDSAEPKTNEELAAYGWNVRPCYKATRKAEQLQRVRGYRLHVTKRSLNLIREARGYTWMKDRDGNALNEPIAVNDHAMDAMRYAIFTWLTEYSSGEYAFGFGDSYLYPDYDFDNGRYYDD